MRLLFILFICFCCIPSFGQQISQIDSVWFAETAAKINQSINENPKRADSLAKIYFAKAKSLHNDEYTGKGATLAHMSIIQLEPEKAEAWYDTAQVYLQRSKNSLWSGYLNMNYGIILTKKYSFESGINYLNKSIASFEEARDTTQLAFAYSSIANAFHDFGNYEKGKEYAFKGLKIVESQKETHRAKWWLLTVLGINYDDNKEYDKAIATHEKALKVATGNDRLLSSTLNNLGNTSKKKGMFAEAAAFFQESLRHSKKSPNNYQFATIYGNLGDLARQQKKYALARKYLDSCLLYSERSASPEKLKDNYEYNSYWYEETGDYKNSLRFIKLYIKLKDSLENVAKAGIIYDAQERYETTKKEKQNQELQAENQLRTVERNKAVSEKRIILTASVTLIILLAAPAYLLYRNKLNRIKRSEEQKMNQALFAGEQNERIRIARDLHDGVGQMLSLVKMNLSTLDPESLIARKAISLVDKTIDEVRNVSHNLIPEELNFGIVPALENLAEKVNSSGDTRMEMEIPDEIKSRHFDKQNELSIYRIVQEVVNNMVKHAGATMIYLSMKQISNTLILSIKDNGHGMDVEALNNSSGIGWKNINARVNLMDGRIKVQSEKLSGTRIEITLPGNEAN
ncbi:MAG: tetratricopeptide repeat protein [Bacteroidota bacterium]